MKSDKKTSRKKKQATIVKSGRLCVLFEEVFKDKGIKIADAFTPKNFAVNKMMVDLAVEGQLLIDGMIFRNTDLSSYGTSRFAQAFRISRIEWPNRLSPMTPYGRAFDDEKKVLLQIFRDNVAHLKNLYVPLYLDVEYSYMVEKQDYFWEVGSEFLAILSLCTGLETLNVAQRDDGERYARDRYASPGSAQVKVMEIMKELPKLTGVQWIGNLTVDKWHAAEDGGVAVRWNVFDYLSPEVTEVCLSDGDEPRLLPWVNERDFANVLKAVMSNKDKRFPKLETLLLPSSFWSLEMENFKSFIEHINAGKIEVIGLTDEFRMHEGPQRVAAGRHVYFCRRMPPPHPRLDVLVKSLTRGMTVDLAGLGICKDAAERKVRLAWAESLTKGEGAFYKCERTEQSGYTFFSLWKKQMGAGGDEGEFEVLIRV